MSLEVTVVGSVNMDLVATAPTLPAPGETVLGHGFSTVPGGKGANQAVAAARAGGRTAFIGAVGSDGFGAELRSALELSGLDTDGLRTVPGPSGVALIAVDDAGENSIVVAPGANGELKHLTVEDRGRIGAASVLVCQLEVPLLAVLEAARAAHDAGTRVILNAAPARALPPELLSLVDLLVVNEGEAAMLASVEGGDPAELAAALLTTVPHVVLTLGGAGSRYAARDREQVAIDAPKVDVVDTTAAGDSFTGALAVAWAEGRDLPDACRWASAAGGVTVQRPGATSALPGRAEIDELYEVTYR
ncbi:ribokinase [Phytomonospora endophytica]|uniref:Ribokinase n=1 Tax=Phytomonospora endophytica TaxID=714109 RepID=A0A841FGP0_9ACTN|nr:ribokinase [Phytomonospora endophytica]MBB6035034.1 ribokinase [Phytomonospora endophytica]GIG68288.1 ribokinase [Phytomonospora endophytica]